MANWKDTLILDDKVSPKLVKLAQTCQKVSAQTSKMRDKIKSLNDRMNKLSTTSKTVFGAVGRLSKAFMGLVGTSGVLTMGIKQTAAFGDRIDKMSQKIGMSQKAFQEWDYIMSQNGGNVESLQMGFKTLVTQIEGVQKGSKDSIRAFKALGVRVKDNNGNFREQEDIFNDVVSRLQKVTNSTDKQRIAQRLLGRSYLEMAPLLNQTAEATENLRKKANRLGLIMTEEEVKNAVEFTDTMDTLGRFFQARINKALTQILPKLSEFFNFMMEFKQPIEAVFKALGKVVELTFKAIGFLAKHKEVLVGIGATLAALAAPMIPAALQAIAWAFIGIGASLSTLNLPLIAISVGIGALVAGLAWLWKNWDTVWGKIKEITNSIISSIAQRIESVRQKIAKLLPFLPALNEANNSSAPNVAQEQSKQLKQSRQSQSKAMLSKIDNSQHNSNNNNSKTYNINAYGTDTSRLTLMRQYT